MQIIDRKNKDYYDYISYQYRDNTTTYDRRGSFVVDDNYLVWFIANHYGTFATLDGNFPKEVIFFLEVGNVQYLISLSKLEFANKHVPRPVYKPGIRWMLPSDIKLKNFEIELIYKYEENKHFLPAPMSISCVWREFSDRNPPYCHKITRLNEFGKPSDCRQFKITNCGKILPEYFINNPILKNSKIPSIIVPSEINKNLENYFSGFYRDKTIEIQMSNKEKIISKGFDPVTSFRNMK
jgi:hypothetical protein